MLLHWCCPLKQTTTHRDPNEKGFQKSLFYNFTILLRLKLWENILDMLYYYIKKNYEKNQFLKFSNPM